MSLQKVAQFAKFLLLSFILASCQGRKNANILDNLNSEKAEFLNKIFEAQPEEGPFHMQYTLRTIFFSKELVSLFGELNVCSGLPHEWKHYEGKTYCKIDGKFKEITFENLFTTQSQKEFLRRYCEKALTKQTITYFSGENPLRSRLEQEHFETFVVDDQCLIIVFQPYIAGNAVDGPFFVKIPYQHLEGHWDPDNPVSLRMQSIVSSQPFVSSWNKENFTYKNM